MRVAVHLVRDRAELYLDLAGETPPLPDPALDQYSEADLDDLRQRPEDRNFEIGERFGLQSADYFESTFRRLRGDGQDYTWDPLFGTISLRRTLNDNEALAVAYRYQRADGTPVEVGDFGQGGGSNSGSPPIILKLLRGQNPLPLDASWDLTMRNIYRVGGSSFNATDFELQVLYAPGAQAPQRTLPGVDIGQQQTLLQTLGLDRLNQDNARAPDDLFDFLGGYTVDSGSGRIIFPYRRPFGDHLRRVLRGEFEELGESPVIIFQGLTEEEAIDAFVFDTLYNAKPEIAARQTAKNVYTISGSFRGSVQEVYDLGFAVVENSVQVRSGNIELSEGADYTVDYATGTVTIVNPAYLTSGRDVKISYERNQFVAIQKKTLLGVRAAYDFSERFAIGATMMRLSEKPIIDKYRLGEEPIANSIWGFDARYEAEPRWMTRLVDALPLVQTRAPSFFEFRGEFAQLNPGHPETLAFDQSRSDLQDIGRDFNEDELAGISYIDDFEGTQNTFSLMQPGAWLLAAAPSGSAASPGAGPEGAATYLTDLPDGTSITDARLRTSWRGLFSWYSVLTATFDNVEIGGLANSRATLPVLINEVFPQRELESGQPNRLSTLDLYIDPSRRGPYNYNARLATDFADNPQEVWGGMMQRLPDGYTDFDARNNIEFVEFIFAPYGGKSADQPIDPNARLYVELGQTSEDIIPNRRFNTEDGLLGGSTTDQWGVIASGQQDGIININAETQQTEDLGLDGLPSAIAAAAAAATGNPYSLTEAEHFADFLDSLAFAGDDPRRALALLDPSADDYRHFQDNAYFNDPSLFPGGATLQERFSQFFSGQELNSLEAQNQIANSGVPGNSRLPDSEDLNLNLSPDHVERFFRYEIPLAEGLVNQPCTDGQTSGCNPFYVTTIFNENPRENPHGREWYLIRIPVRSELREAIGGIEDFSLIESVRLWTDGHAVPATMRFAKLDLVGSQWLKSDRVGLDPDDGPEIGLPDESGLTQSFVATINNEENPNQYRIPNGAVRSFTRDPASGRPRQNREQAILFRVDNLGDGQARAIFKPYTQQLDLTKYSNLRMFVHGEGFERRDSVRVFVRLGSNETDDYYEIEQPVYPYSPPPEIENISAIPGIADSLWQTNVPIQTPDGTRFVDLNSINIEFDALNILKVERDFAQDDRGNPLPLDSVYTARNVPLDFAPEGAVLRIKGSPSTKSISSIVMGVRNGRDPLGQPRNVEIWFNELRTSGFDEQSGWSAYARTTIRLADFLDINARYDQQTDGFGDLASGLGNRIFEDSWGYSVTTNLNAHKFLPERYGWRLPVNLAVQQSVATPRFSPSRGDITVAQEIAQIQESDLSPEEQDREIEEIRAAAETATFSRVIRVPISKSGSRSPWLRYTLDGLSLTYTNTLREQRSPSRRFNDTDQWSGTASYRLTVPRPKTVRPLWFLDEIPLVGFIGGLQLNVLPQSFQFSADASRAVNENQDRPRRTPRIINTIGDEARLAAEQFRTDFVFPIRQQHTFSHRRNAQLQYNPFQFLALGYRSDVRQSLNTTGADESFFTLVQDYSSGDVTNFQEYNLSRDEVIEQIYGGTLPDSIALYPVSRLDVIPAPQVIGDVLTGERPILTDDYNQNFTATMQSPVERVRALNWFRLQPLTFTSAFTWRYTPLPGVDPRLRADTVTVAGVTNQASLRGGLSLRLGELFGKIGPYERLREAQTEAEQTRQQRRQRFENDLTAFRTAQQRAEEAELALREAEAADTTGGTGEGLVALREAYDAARVAADTLQRPSPPLPIPNPLSLARRGFLALTGPRDLTVTYNGSFGGSSQGVRDPGYSLLDALTGDGPSLAYRLGLQRRIDADERFFGSEEGATIQVQDNLRDNHQFTARTALEFSQALRVDLNWNLGFDLQRTYNYGRGDLSDPTISESGSGNATILAIGGSYEDFFRLHRARYDRATEADPDLSDGLETDLLTNNAVVEDFRSAFVTSLSDIGRGGFNALPLPNWTVTYSGISNWPILRALTQSATLRHGYSATYDAGFSSNPLPGSPNEETLRLSDGSGATQSIRLLSETPFLEAQTVRVSERFQPLLGVNLAFKGGFQTDINWNTSANNTLAAANASVNQTETQELSLRLSFNKTGIRLPLPFLGRRRLNNNLRFSLIVSQANNLSRRFSLLEDLQQDIAGNRTLTFLNPEGERTTRLSIEPQLSYTLSNQVTAAVFVRYQKFDSEGSRNPSTTTINGGFNFRVSFSN